MTTVETFDLCAPAEDLCFTRGDTFVWERRIVDEQTPPQPRDITGFGFTLTVDSQPNPPDTSTNVFSIVGTVPVGTDGIVRFQFSLANWAAYTAAIGEPPNVAFYDLQQTDGASDPRSIRKGKFRVDQDITK